MTTTFNIVVFISGTGSNLQSILAKQSEYDYRVSLVVTNNNEAEGLNFAEHYNVPTFTFDWKNADDALTNVQKKINAHVPKLIVLAGFMKILPEKFLNAYPNKIINIHPSLLPKYPGLHTHQRVLDNHDSIHGATVHYVNAQLDAGKIISQTQLAVNSSHDEQSLAKDLLFREHSLLPHTIALIRQNRVKWHGSNLYFEDKILTQPILLND